MSQISVEYENSACRNTLVYGLFESVKRSKYPLATDIDTLNEDVTPTVKRLVSMPIGSGDDTFMNGIIVQFDLTLSKQAWYGMERYHFMNFVSSQSTMHCISKMNILHQCNEFVDSYAINALEIAVQRYLDAKRMYEKREMDFYELEDYFYRMIYSIPSGFRLTAGMTTNYRQLKTIYRQRRNHRLVHDWGDFCDWIEHLPYSEWITGKTEKSEIELEHASSTEEQLGRDK